MSPTSSQEFVLTSRSASLQTSPYLTCICPGDASPIVYAIDEAMPTVPEVTPAPGAQFGVIGLERTVAWHPDLRGLHALQEAAAAPVDEQLLTERFGAEIVADLVDRGWLQRPDQLCVDYLLTTAQIEVTAHCNWGCQFCPVSVDRKPAATMPMPLFREIIEKIAVHDTIRYVTLRSTSTTSRRSIPTSTRDSTCCASTDYGSSCSPTAVSSDRNARQRCTVPVSSIC